MPNLKLLLAGLSLAFGLTARCNAHETAQLVGCGCSNSLPELWVVNSRAAPVCCGLDEGFHRITYERWDASRCVFVRESLESFLAAQADIPTLLFSHGNTLTHEQAMKSCWKIRERLGVCPGRKLMVYWSWPAEILYTKPLVRPIYLLRKNIKAKYVYSEYQGYYIAKLANMMSTAQPLTLGGHSYGGVTVICALHYLGGGELNGLVLDGCAPVERPNLRAAIVSGALDNDHLYPGHRYGQAFDAVETFYTTYNDRDATLKRWPIHSFRGQQAMGYTGICASLLGSNGHKLFQQKLTEDVGTSHYIKPHLASDRMVAAICCTAFPGTLGNCQSGAWSQVVDPASLPEEMLDHIHDVDPSSDETEQSPSDQEETLEISDFDYFDLPDEIATRTVLEMPAL